MENYIIKIILVEMRLKFKEHSENFYLKENQKAKIN